MLLGLVSGEVSSILRLPPHPTHRANCHSERLAAVGPRPQLVARAGSYIRLFVVLASGILIVLTSPARATPLARPVIGGKPQQTMNYAVGLTPDKRLIILDQLGLKIDAKIS